MKEIIIAGIFTIVGALISGLLSHYGMHSIFRILPLSEAIIKCVGSAEELEVSFTGFQYQRPLISFVMDDMTFVIKGKSIIGTGPITTHHSDGSTVSGEIKGKGPLVGNFAYIQYKVQETAGTSWIGMCVLEIPPRGEIYGYWLAQDIYGKAHFTFGKASFKRK